MLFYLPLIILVDERYRIKIISEIGYNTDISRLWMLTLMKSMFSMTTRTLSHSRAHRWQLAQEYCSVNPVSSTLRKQIFVPKFDLDSSFSLCFLRILNPFKRIQKENNCSRSKMKARSIVHKELSQQNTSISQLRCHILYTE